jgi:Spy/CpxP family protein refolding chaperone
MVREAIENPEKVRGFIERRLDRRLELDGDQRKKLHDILVDAHQQLKDLRLEFRPRFALIISEADTNITAILTPEQRERFEEFKAENPMIWQPGVRKE